VKLIKKVLLCYGVSILIYALILLWGISIDPMGLFGYVLISFYFLLPVTSFIFSLLLSITNSRTKWLYPFLFGAFGTAIAIIVLQRMSWILDVLPILIAPAFAGLVISLVIQKIRNSIIKEHNLTLYGALRENTITLHPLCDDHLPLLYKWNTDPEVLYWNEGPDADPNDNNNEAVQSIYKDTSNAGYCFLIEIDGIAIGECLLCKMNVDYILEKYHASTDVRRIDILIGEKSYWNMGVGTAIVQMLIDFAFNTEKADVVYGITGDYNKRSGRVFEKNGFCLFGECPTDNDPEEDSLELHYRLTRDEYEKSRA